ncbi:hypothetical protein M1247_01795 [Mycobacterium sp. 21AC1]|uniref:hypothetical protein n=1 Tax=[Mycobacterium] appelbergii TaxID=2939269 RepID=UPI0029390444|nr:hypothetical protein [Mycobacterium sp. 21AC1]MDV3123636.1 hypothetical protein [Mycobacterium sp. 21AC1]
MPDDLLRHLMGPPSYSSGWLWIAVALALALIAWYAAVFVLTAPGRRLRDLPLIGAARDEMIKHRFARAVRAIANRYRAGDLTAPAAGAAMSREVRAFLQAATGVRAQYMQVDDIATGALAPAAPVLADLTDAQFNDQSTIDVAAAGDCAEELIRGWT